MSKSMDLTGQKIGMLEILKRKRELDDKGRTRTFYYCKCDCENEKWIRADCITRGQKSCGCSMESTQFKTNNLTNQIFGRLKAIEPTKKRAENGCVVWKCECKCGNIKEVSEGDLTGKRVQSCGCLTDELRSIYGKRIGELNVKENVIQNTHIKVIKSNKLLKTNKTGFKGVCFDEKRNKFIAQIGFKKKHYFLGRFDKAEDASEAYQEAKKKLHGEFIEWYNNEYKKQR